MIIINELQFSSRGTLYITDRSDNVFFSVKCLQDHASMVRQRDYERVGNEDFRTCTEAMQSLWSDPGIQECYNRRREYQLTDSAK